MGWLIAVAANLGLLGAAWICGRPARCLRELPLAPGEEVALRLLAGIGFLGLGLFVIGQVYFTPVLGIGILAAGGSAVFLPGFRAGVVAALRVFGTSWAGRFSLAILAFLFVAGLAEPVGPSGHDGIAYHLLGPKVWLREGRIGVVLDYFACTYPSTIEMMFGVLMPAGPRGACAFGAVLAAAFLLQLHGLARLLGAGESTGGLAMAAIVAMPVVTVHSISAFVDLPFAAFALAAIRLGLVSTRPAHMLMTGCFLGFCAGTKYAGLIVIAVTLPTLAIAAIRHGECRLIRGITGAGVLAVLIGCPWYLRNWYWLGTPIYPPPVLGDVFKPRGMPPESLRAFLSYTLNERGRGMGRSMLDFALLPFRLTYFTANFHGAGGIGLLPLGFGWLGLWLARHQHAARMLAVWAGLLTAAWFITQQEARFLIHAIAVAGMFGAVGAATALWDGDRLLRGLTTVVIGVSLAYGAVSLFIQHADAIRAVVSPSFALERHRKLVPYSDAFDYLNQAEGVRSILILDYWVPPYYLDRPYVKPIGAYGVFPIEGIRTGRDAVQGARRLGVSHVLDVRVPGDAAGGPSDFVVRPEDGFTLVFATDDSRIYAVK